MNTPKMLVTHNLYGVIRLRCCINLRLTMALTVYCPELDWFDVHCLRSKGRYSPDDIGLTTGKIHLTFRIEGLSKWNHRKHPPRTPTPESRKIFVTASS